MRPCRLAFPARAGRQRAHPKLCAGHSETSRFFDREDGDNFVRHVYLNVPHSEIPKLSWYGESVGHYEGETIDVSIYVEDPGAFTMPRYARRLMSRSPRGLHFESLCAEGNPDDFNLYPVPIPQTDTPDS